MAIINSINSDEALRATTKRAREILDKPLVKSLDATYVRELNAYIFQDMRSLGIAYSAGQFRQGSSSLDDLNVSSRTLTDITIFSMRSYMDTNAIERFEKTLRSIDCKRLSCLSTKNFIQKISCIYALLDYTHPFVDGNSRTFRALTYQIANNAGFYLNWDKIAQSKNLREALYCARCKEVNTLALNEQSVHKDKISNMLEMLDENYPKEDLHTLLTRQNLVIPKVALDFNDCIQAVLCQIKTQSDVDKLIPLMTVILQRLVQKYPHIVSLRQIIERINAPLGANATARARTLVDIILPDCYKRLEQNK